MEVVDLEKSLSNMQVIKRNLRRVPFESAKIAIAIKKGFDSIYTQNYTDKDVNKVYIAVLKEIYDLDIPKIKIEKIQDIIEQKLKKLKYLPVYESFSNYRNNRTKVRDAFDQRKSYKFLSVVDKLRQENIFASDSINIAPKEKIQTLGMAVSSYLATSQIIKRKYLELHDTGNIFIHNLESIPSGMSAFTQLDLTNILQEGFDVNYGYVRGANNIAAYVNLTLNIMMLCAKEQYYGQSIPAFDHYMAKGVLKSFKKEFKALIDYSLELTQYKQFLPMNSIYREIEKIDSIEFDIDVFDQYIRSSSNVKDIFKSCYLVAKENTITKTFKAMQAFVHNINTIAIDNTTPYIYCLNLGTDTTNEGRLVTKTLFDAINQGMGSYGNKPIYPKIVFKVKKGINIEKDDPNYDLLQGALLLKQDCVSFSLLDTSFNKKLYNGTYLTECAYINGIRTIENNLDDKRAIVGKRGLLGVVSINLPTLAIKTIKENKSFNKQYFFGLLDDMLQSAKQVLFDRFEELSLKNKKDFPMLLMQDLWLDADKIKENDKLRRAFKHGILGIGYTGLYECLVAIFKKGKVDDMQKAHKLGIEIVKYMRKKCDEFSEEYTLNYQLIALPEDYDPDMFIDTDKIIHGKIKGVTDIPRYTNSFKQSPLLKLTIDQRLQWDGAFHKYNNAGHCFGVDVLKEFPQIHSKQMLDEIKCLQNFNTSNSKSVLKVEKEKDKEKDKVKDQKALEKEIKKLEKIKDEYVQSAIEIIQKAQGHDIGYLEFFVKDENDKKEDEKKQNAFEC